MKKGKLLGAGVLALATLMTGVIASATGSGYVSAPSSTAGSWKRGTYTYNCYSSASTALTSNSYTYFKDATTLGSSFASNNKRTLTVELWDADPKGNSNDKLKTYVCKFSGRTPSLSFTITQNNYDSIDGTGDDCAELYIWYKVDKMDKDPSEPSISSGLFKYNVGVK